MILPATRPNHALMRAAEAGDVAGVQAALAAGASVNAARGGWRGDPTCSVLLRAVLKGHAPVARTLLAAGAPLWKSQVKQGRNPVEEALLRGTPEMVWAFVEAAGGLEDFLHGAQGALGKSYALRLTYRLGLEDRLDALILGWIERLPPEERQRPGDHIALPKVWESLRYRPAIAPGVLKLLEAWVPFPTRESLGKDLPSVMAALFKDTPDTNPLLARLVGALTPEDWDRRLPRVMAPGSVLGEPPEAPTVALAALRFPRPGVLRALKRSMATWNEEAKALWWLLHGVKAAELTCKSGSPIGLRWLLEHAPRHVFERFDAPKALVDVLENKLAEPRNAAALVSVLCALGARWEKPAGDGDTALHRICREWNEGRRQKYRDRWLEQWVVAGGALDNPTNSAGKTPNDELRLADPAAAAHWEMHALQQVLPASASVPRVRL